MRERIKEEEGKKSGRECPNLALELIIVVVAAALSQCVSVCVRCCACFFFLFMLVSSLWPEQKQQQQEQKAMQFDAIEQSMLQWNALTLIDFRVQRR